MSAPFEAGPRPPHQEEKVGKERPVVQVVEFRDAEGRLLGRARIELEQEDIDLSKATGQEGLRGRALRAIVLEGEKDGLPTSLDLLELANPHGAKVIVAEEWLETSFADVHDLKAFVRPIGGLMDVGTLLHELGHIDQYFEKDYKELHGFHNVQTTGIYKKLIESGMLRTSLVERLRKIMEAVPDARALVDDDLLAQLESLAGRFDDAYAKQEREITDANERLEEKLAKGEDVRAKSMEEYDAQPEQVAIREFMRLAKAIEQLTREAHIGDLLELPTRILERDATRRALEWLREVRKRTGIDVFASFNVAEKNLPLQWRKENADACQASVQEGAQADEHRPAETSALEYLRKALASYGADKFRLKPLGGEGPGVMPSAGRKEKT